MLGVQAHNGIWLPDDFDFGFFDALKPPHYINVCIQARALYYVRICIMVGLSDAT